MLRRLLDFGAHAARPLALAVLLAGARGALAQGVTSTEPVPAPPETAAPVAAPTAEAAPARRDLSEWALAAAALSLLGMGYLIVSRPKAASRSTLRTAGVDLSPLPQQLSAGQSKEVEEIVKRVLRQQAGAAAAAPKPAPAQNQPKPAANRPLIKTASTALPPETPAAPVAAAPEIAAEPVASAETLAAPVPEPVGPRRAYVSSAPVNGRFRRNALQEQPAHNSIYELTTDPAQPDQATFRVNPDPASHPRHISSYADVLEPACEFNLPQGAASRIITEAPGLLRRVDGDDWEIVRKARIHFA